MQPSLSLPLTLDDRPGMESGAAACAVGSCVGSSFQNSLCGGSNSLYKQGAVLSPPPRYLAAQAPQQLDRADPNVHLPLSFGVDMHQEPRRIRANAEGHQSVAALRGEGAGSERMS